jgi:hypothetical protein
MPGWSKFVGDSTSGTQEPCRVPGTEHKPGKRHALHAMQSDVQFSHPLVVKRLGAALLKGLLTWGFS